MNVTVSIALASGVITVALVWTKRVGIASAIVVWTSGFTAAATTMAGPVNDLLTALVHAVSQ